MAPTPSISSREYARRQHRAFALRCLLQCWRRRVDGLTIDAAELKELFGLERLREGRAKQLKADIRPWFVCDWDKRAYRSPSGVANYGQPEIKRFNLIRHALVRPAAMKAFDFLDMPSERELNALGIHGRLLQIERRRVPDAD